MTKLRFVLVLVAFAVLSVLGLYAWTRSSHPLHNLTYQTDPTIKIGGPFALTNQFGKPTTEAILKGKWTAVFFGYTYCPDVCPLTMQVLGRTQTALGAKAGDLQIVFVTIDPDRDTASNLKAYLESGGFPKGVIGLTGSQDQIDKIAKAYRVSYDKKTTGPHAYEFSHTSVVYLMDPDGQFSAPLTADMSPQQNAQLIKQAMAGSL